MRSSKALASFAIAVTAAVVGVPAVASADPSVFLVHVVQHPNGDRVSYDTNTDLLRICDNSRGNGTANGVLHISPPSPSVVHRVVDTNGAQPGCGKRRLNVDDSNRASVWVCSSRTLLNCRAVQIPSI